MRRSTNVLFGTTGVVAFLAETVALVQLPTPRYVVASAVRR